MKSEKTKTKAMALAICVVAIMLTSSLPTGTAVAQPADSPGPMTNPDGTNSVTKTKTDYITLTTIENLLINPDAETGDTQGWVDLDDAWSADDEVTPHGGDYFFWPARLDIPYTQMYQDVDISEYASSIDSCNAYLHLSGWLANWDQYPHDRATLAIEALDTNNQQLLYLSRHHRSPVWTYYKIESKIPAGSRTLRILLIATRYVGADNDGYFDDLCLEVDNNAPDVFVTITPEGGVPEVAVGSTLQLYATTTGGVDSADIWSSSFNAVATVDESGLVTAHQTGRCVIQAEGTSTHAVGYLEIVAYSPNYVIFTHPQSGEKWEGGTNHDITWELIGSIDSGTLYYSTTGGSEWTEIDQIPDLSVQQYSWLVPDTDEILNDCIIKMVWDGGEATSSVFSIVPSKPIPATISIETDEFEYSPGNTMTITMDIANPTEDSVTFQWYWVVPQFSVCVPVMSVPIPAGYDDTLNFSFTIPDRGSTPFGDVFYTELTDASGEVLDADVTWWAYSPGAAKTISGNIGEEIKKTIEEIG